MVAMFMGAPTYRPADGKPKVDVVDDLRRNDGSGYYLRLSGIAGSGVALGKTTPRPSSDSRCGKDKDRLSVQSHDGAPGGC
ncbi:hypothetical protein [Streptomyces sp. NBC_01190]|uniref:hypothetical protein n=1 Tax=Streptomyces sp. NBC_01190 TaxID=2903767 RepID=UPI00386CD5A9|nr:hypothetical protein OG519_13205 [Streptomyces sp. NBC_01190]